MYSSYPILLIGLLNLISCGSSSTSPNHFGAGGAGASPLVNKLKYYNTFAFNHVYTLNLTIGSQIIETVLDTGSANLLAIGDSSYCPNCVNEYGYTSVYTPEKTSKKLTSTWSMSFAPIGQATVQGYSDNVTFQNLTIPNYSFGLVTSEKGIPNIWGIAYQPVAQPSSSPQVPLFDALISNFELNNQFSLTLCALKNGSSVTLGGYDSKLTSALLNQVLWTPISKKQWYSVYLSNMYIPSPSAGSGALWVWTPEASDIVIVDSGTNPIVIPSSQISPLVTVLKSYATQNKITLADSFWPTSTSKGGFGTLTSAQIAAFPTINVNLMSFTKHSESILLSISPKTYFQTDSKGQVFLAIQPGASNLYILGTAFMENYVVLHDRGDNTVGKTDPTAKLGFFPVTSNFCN